MKREIDFEFPTVAELIEGLQKLPQSYRVSLTGLTYFSAGVSDGSDGSPRRVLLDETEADVWDD